MHLVPPQGRNELTIYCICARWETPFLPTPPKERRSVGWPPPPPKGEAAALPPHPPKGGRSVGWPPPPPEGGAPLIGGRGWLVSPLAFDLNGPPRPQSDPPFRPQPPGSLAAPRGPCPTSAARSRTQSDSQTESVSWLGNYPGCSGGVAPPRRGRGGSFGSCTRRLQSSPPQLGRTNGCRSREFKGPCSGPHMRRLFRSAPGPPAFSPPEGGPRSAVCGRLTTPAGRR
jgi:hypothetical protein